MALVAPVFFLMIFGLLEVIRLGMVMQLMTNATREACRFAVVAGTKNDQLAEVKNKLVSSLAGSGIDMTQYGTITVTASHDKVSFGQPIQVTASIPFNKVTWLPASGLLPSWTITTTAIMSQERPNP